LGSGDVSDAEDPGWQGWWARSGRSAKVSLSAPVVWPLYPLQASISLSLPYIKALWPEIHPPMLCTRSFGFGWLKRWPDDTPVGGWIAPQIGKLEEADNVAQQDKSALALSRLYIEYALDVRRISHTLASV